jgi:hypothetical protein
MFVVVAFEERNLSAKETAAKNAAMALQVQASLDAFLAGDIEALKRDFYYKASNEQKSLANAKNRELWRNGLVNRVHSSDRITILRIKGDRVETSKGAQFPVSDAVRAYPLIKKVKDMGETWVTNGHKIPLGHFRIDRIESDGTVKAGCHIVQWNEIELIARQLNIA